MCLYVDKEHRNMQTATKAIKVFKLLRICCNEYVSPCMHARYAVGSTYHSDMVMEDGIVKAGLHAYQTKAGANRSLFNTWSTKTVVVPMIIPKGAHYYLGDSDDIVSDALVWSTPNTFRQG